MCPRVDTALRYVFDTRGTFAPVSFLPPSLSVHLHRVPRVSGCVLTVCAQVDAKLSIHAGIGAGALCAYRVGASARWEFLVAGATLRVQHQRHLFTCEAAEVTT